jgi:hypothetical protein
MQQANESLVGLVALLRKYPDFKAELKKADNAIDIFADVTSNLNRMADQEENPVRPKARRKLFGGTEKRGEYQIPNTPEGNE